jgi:transcriptional regulator with XRE-family HTH domain
MRSSEVTGELLAPLWTRIPALPFCKSTLKTERKRAGYPCFVNHLGDHIRKRRLDVGLQLKQLAQQLGAHEQCVASWERGLREPSIRFWPKLILFLGHDPRPLPETLADRVRHRRIGLGLTIKQLASELGVDPGTLADWEGGRRQPAGKFLAKVSGLLGEDLRPAATTLAQRLRRRREDLALSQRAMAKRLGVNSATLVRWETGRREPQGEVRKRVEADLVAIRT